MKFTQKASMAYNTDRDGTCRCDLYYDKTKNNHKTFTVNTTGLLIDEDHPVLGAFPDGIVTCSCYGTGLLEIKCTYKFRNETIQSVADQDYHCDIEKGEEDNLYRLKRFSPWYTQCRWGVCKVPYCNFILFVTGPTEGCSDIMVERICSTQISGIQGKSTFCMQFY